MPERQVTSFPILISSGLHGTLGWNWPGINHVNVPPNTRLIVSTLTLNFFPHVDGVVGAADIRGVDPAYFIGWQVGAYVEPKKTLHLTFPHGLRLRQGSHVEIMSYDGPGSIYLNANGILQW